MMFSGYTHGIGACSFSNFILFEVLCVRYRIEI